MPKKLKGGATVPRKSALWVQEYYHTAAGFCARATRVSVGEFVEAALDAYIASQSELEPLKPALTSMRDALREVGRVSRDIEDG